MTMSSEEKPRKKKKGKRGSLQDKTLLEEWQTTTTVFRGAELLGVMFDQKQILSDT